MKSEVKKTFNQTLDNYPQIGKTLLILIKTSINFSTQVFNQKQDETKMQRKKNKKKFLSSISVITALSSLQEHTSETGTAVIK